MKEHWWTLFKPGNASGGGAEAKQASEGPRIRYFKVPLSRESTGFERAKLLKDFREEDWKPQSNNIIVLQNVVKEHVQLYRDF